MKSLDKIKKRLSTRSYTITGIIMVMICLFVSCDFNTEINEKNTFYSETDLSITQYIESHPERFSILSDILDTTGLKHLFRTYGDYTFLAPTDSAFKNYFTEIGKTSYKDFTEDELIKLVKYHVFGTRYLSGAFNLGIVESKTLTFDYMVSGPTEDGSDVIFNKRAKIITKDIELPNGIFHTIDNILYKPQQTIVGWLQQNKADYSIFFEALEKTGLDQKFNNYDPESNDFTTCFVTPDKKYAENNINSFADLAKMISPNNTNYLDSTNILNAFIGSHFTKNIISMSNATESPLYLGTVGGATFTFGLKPNTAEVVLNYHTSDFPEGLSIDEFNSNNLVSNGIIHLMDTMFQLPKALERTKRLFIICDVPGLPYDSVFAANMLAVEDGTWDDLWHRYWPRPGEGLHIPWERSNGWLTLNAPYSGFIRFDHHRRGDSTTPQAALYGEVQPIFLGYDVTSDLIDFTRKIPYVIPGKYKLIHYLKAGPTRGSVLHYWNGKSIGGVKNLAFGKNEFQDIEIGIVEIKEGENEHFIRVEAISPGYGFFVAFKLEPVN